MGHTAFIACCIVVVLSGVCCGQFSGASRLDTHSGYFEAVTHPPTESTSGSWSQTAQLNPPLSVLLSGSDEATQASQNGSITSTTTGSGKVGVNASTTMGTCFAKGTAAAVAQGNATVNDIADSEIEADSSGDFIPIQNAAGTAILVLNFNNVPAPATIVSANLTARVGTASKTAYYLGNGVWRVDGANFGAAKMTFTIPVAYVGGTPVTVDAVVNVYTTTAGAGGGFSKSWHVDTLAY